MVKNKVDCLFFLIIFPCNSSETLVIHSFRFFIPIKSYWVLDPKAVDICIQRHNFLGFVAFGFWGLFLNRFVFVSRLYYFFQGFFLIEMNDEVVTQIQDEPIKFG